MGREYPELGMLFGAPKLGWSNFLKSVLLRNDEKMGAEHTDPILRKAQVLRSRK